MMYTKSIAAIASAIISIGLQAVDAKAVYAHYMVGGLTDGSDQGKQDVESALAMGFDGFALNVQQPDQPFTTGCLDQIFAAAAGTNFKVFFSIDLSWTGSLDAFQPIFSRFTDEAYLKVGDDQRPFVSSFRGGNLGLDPWRSLKDQHNVYLVPNFEDYSDSYYSDPQGFFNAWGDVIDGAYNWETAWPDAQVDAPANVTSDRDASFQNAAAAAGKEFMMPLSPLQYKHCCGNNYYRIGEGNLPERISQILEVKPDRVEFITWNDAGESHYIGHIWESSLTGNDDILAYANTDEFPHYAWQPIVTSFIQAYKDGKSSAEMLPPGDAPVGAIWYRGVLKSCNTDAPAHAEAAVDAVIYAFVLPASLEGAKIRVTSGDTVIAEDTAHAGLNYNTVGGISLGKQKVEIVNGDNVVATAAGDVEVQESLPDFCNFNYYVYGLQ